METERTGFLTGDEPHPSELVEVEGGVCCTLLPLFPAFNDTRKS